MSYKVLDLFSGIGGFSLGLERAGMETIAFCEFDEHARKVLNKHWPNVPIHKDVRVLDGNQYRGAVNVVCGGFPCQDLSVAGEKKGFEGYRSSLYREMLRIISECLPRYAIFENVTGLLTGQNGQWFAKFLCDLAEVGYDAEWHCISASYIGAPHERDRIWIIAYPRSEGLQRSIFEGFSLRIEQGTKSAKFGNRDVHCSDTWPELSSYLRVGDGLSRWSHEITRLGNAVIPQIPELIGKAIIEFEKKQSPNI